MKPTWSKWLRHLKHFIEIFTPGGTVYSRSGIAATISRTGHLSVPPSEWKKMLYQYMDENEKWLPHGSQRSDRANRHPRPN